MNRRLLFILTFFLPLFVTAQDDLNRIDSLIQILDQQEGREKIETMLALSEAYDLVSFDKSIETGQKAIAEAEQLNLLHLKAKVLKSLGISSINNNDYELAEDYIRQALDIFRIVGDSVEIAATIHNIGLIQSETGHYEESIQSFFEAIELFKKLGLEGRYADSYHTLGTVYYSLGQFDAALDVFKQAQIIYIKENDSLDWANITFNISMVYWQWDQNKLALDILDSLAPIFQRFDCPKEFARTIYSKGLIYLYDFGNKEEALKCFNQSLEINKKVGKPLGIALNYINIANILIDMDMYKEAFEYFEKGLAIHQSINNNEGILMAFYHMGLAYQKMGNYQKSNEMFDKCMELSKKLLTHNYDVIISEARIKNSFKLRNEKDFEESFMSYKANFDSLNLIVNDLRMKEARGRYKNEELLLVLDSETEKNELLNDKVIYYRIFVGALVFGLVILLIVFLLTGRKKIK